MLEKFEILLIIFVILSAFYIVIYLGSGGKKKISESKQIKNYMSGVRILIIIIAVVCLILWTFI